MSGPTRVLVVDDDQALLETYADELPGQGLVVATASSGAQALESLEPFSTDVVVTDLQMKGLSGTELAARVRELRPDIPVILVTGFGDLPSAIDAIRAGAYDYLVKPISVEALALAIERAARERRLRHEVQRLQAIVGGGSRPGDIIGESEAMKEVFDLVARVARSSSTVLVCGESGTGKELVARAVHAMSERADGPFVALNCAALPEALLESELFGHEKGAFTGAATAKRGLLLEARGGTIFLDEVGELAPTLQPKVLRALQERTVRRVGGTREETFDARLVAATNRDLAAAVERGEFREDLFYRLSVIEIDLPPLRSRGNDVMLLAGHFLRRLAERDGQPLKRLSVEAADRLLAWHWPGNVRELENAIERAVTLARGEEIVPADLPKGMLEDRPPPAINDLLMPGDDVSKLPPLAEVERLYIERVLEATGGNKSLAAKILGLDRKTIYRKLGT